MCLWVYVWQSHSLSAYKFISLHSRIAALPTSYNIANVTATEERRFRHPAISWVVRRGEQQEVRLLTVTHQNGFRSTVTIGVPTFALLDTFIYLD
jgi:hypothetical protein